MIRILFILFSVSCFAQKSVMMQVATQPTAQDVIVPMELKAFPEAEGFGKYTTGGRGGQVVEISNLNTSGSGSLDAFLRMTVPRIGVFTVSGVIKHSGSDYLVVPPGCGNFTLDGATAPGEGIEIQGTEIRIHESNIILRNLRIRSNSDDVTESNVDGINIVPPNDGTPISNIIIDRCSIWYTVDESVAIFGKSSTTSFTENVTVQRSILANPMGSYGFLIGPYTKNISLIHNMIGFCSDRYLYSSYGNNNSYEAINNYIYGFYRYENASFGEEHDKIGNVYQKSSERALFSESVLYRLISTGNTGSNVASDSNIHANDNITIGYQPTDFYNTDYAAQNQATRRITNSLVTPFESGLVTTRLIDTEGLGVGATPWNRDAIDAALINLSITGNGTKKSSVSFLDDADFANPSGVTRPLDFDQDNDGMADSWELTKGFDTSIDDSATPYGENGYTRFDAYMGYLNNEPF